MVFKYLLIVVISFSVSIAQAQDIVGDWEIMKLVETSSGQNVFLYEKNAPNNVLNYSDMSVTYVNDGTYSASNANGAVANGTWNLSNNQLTIDGRVFDFISVNQDEFYTIQDKEYMDENFNISIAVIETYYSKIFALPISLKSFNGEVKGNSVVLNWKTASETNNDYFEIQYSEDGNDFKEIGKQKGNGTSNLENNYSFIHVSPKSGINYYKLKQVDFNGEFEYSNIISVDFNSSSFEIFPNPTTEIITISSSGTNSNSKLLKIEVLNSNGKKVMEIDNPDKSINISELDKGLHLIILNLKNGESEIHKFVKN